MTRAKRLFLCGVFLATLAPGLFAASRQAPDPQEVYDIIRTNLSGMSDAQLQTAAVDGLIKELAPRVWLADSQNTPSNTGPILTKLSVFDGSVGYLRIGTVDDGTDRVVRQGYLDLSSTNTTLQGLIFDLRFAEGQAYQAAASTADLFVAKEQPLLDWGAGSARSTAKTNAIRMPVAVLINQQTAGAAEALAGILRDAGVAILIGTNTAGRAVQTEDFVLKNGEHLRIAREGIRLGSGALLTPAGVKPDIAVAVSPQDEKVFWSEPYKDLASAAAGTALGGTNANGVMSPPLRRRINEAELFRERRNGMEPLAAAAASVINKDTEVEMPLVHDPALARALDLIKGLAVVRQRHE